MIWHNIKKNGSSVLNFKFLFYVFIFLFCLMPVSMDAATTIAKPMNYLSLTNGLVGWWTFDGKSTSWFPTQTIYITSGSTWTVPADWNNANNTIETIGGGGASADQVGGIGKGGGGGGAYSKITNLSLTPSASVDISVGTGGAHDGTTTGGDTWFNGASLAASSVGAKGGSGTSNGTGAAGGVADDGVGTTKYSGGAGGNSGVWGYTGGGGGGAGGPDGAGANGSTNGVGDPSDIGGAGGTGGNGSGGAGGAGGAGLGGSGSPGGAGTELGSSKGSGGGGGGAGGASVQDGAGGTGGIYGGGGGGAGGSSASSNSNGGSGGNGVIVVTYIPATPNTTNDISGNGNTGTLTNMSQSLSPVPGKIGQALNFDGSDDYVDINNPSSLQITDETICAWLKTRVTTSLDYIYASRSSVGGGSIYTSSNKISFLISSTDSAQTSNTAINDGRWNHVCVTFVDSTDVVSYFFNGGTDGASSNATAFVHSASKTIGNRSGGGSSTAFNGSIDDVRVYSRALSAGEITQLYNLGAATKISATSKGLPGVGLNNGLVGHWTFDGPKMLSNVADSSISGNTGYLVHSGSGTTTTAGKLGQALSFDGVDDYVIVNNNAAFNSQSAMTWSFWIYDDNCILNNEIVSKGGQAGGTDTVWATWERADCTIVIRLINSTLTLSTQVTRVLDIGKWTHITFTYDGTNIIPYKNGVAGSPVAFSGTLNTTTQSITFANSINFNKDASIKLDDIRIYNRALSAGEVQQLYNLGR